MGLIEGAGCRVQGAGKKSVGSPPFGGRGAGKGRLQVVIIC
jgi:hypothetical protein